MEDVAYLRTAGVGEHQAVELVILRRLMGEYEAVPDKQTVKVARAQVLRLQAELIELFKRHTVPEIG